MSSAGATSAFPQRTGHRRPMGLVRILLATLLVLSAPLVCAGGTIHVPGDYPTVLAGVDAAVSGDSVIVAQGANSQVWYVIIVDMT